MVAIFVAVTWPADAANSCNLSGADRVEVVRFDRPSRYAETTDAEWMAVPTTWESSQSWEAVLERYRYEARRYAWVTYYAGETALHYVDVKRGDGVLYAIVLPADRGGHGCAIVQDDLDGYVETWLDWIVQ